VRAWAVREPLRGVDYTLKRDYAVTFGVTALTIISYLIAFRLVARHLGGGAFGEYALARRTVSILAPAAILGADYATARFVAYAVGAGRQGEPYLIAALSVMVASVAAVSLLLVTLSGAFARLFYGSSQYSNLMVMMVPLLLGVGLHSVAYNYLRGTSRFVTSSMLLFINYAVVPLAAVYAGSSVLRILLAMAAGWVVVSVCFLARMPVVAADFRRHVREILRYGVPRVPGDLLQMSLLGAPGILAAHLASIQVAGLVAFGTASLAMVGSAMSPVAFVLLPVSARMLGAGQVAELRRHVTRVLAVITVAVVVGTLLLEAVATPLVGAYLGKGFEGGTYVMRVIMLAGLPYAVYFTLKSVVDAKHLRAINTRNMGAAVLVFAGTTALATAVGLSVGKILAAFVLSIYVLACLTGWEVWKIFVARPGLAAAGPGGNPG
jgi:O-antigen/teichoic acid export membrane protein